MSSDRRAASYWVKAAPTSCCTVSTANSTRRSAARIADGAPRRACEVERQRRERQLSFQCEQSVGRHTSEPLQLERGDLDTALGELPACVQAIHFHELQALVERRCGPLAHSCPYHLE